MDTKSKRGEELGALLEEIGSVRAMRRQRGAAEKLPYFPLYAEDFYRGTRKFTREERDMYLELLICEWNDGYLPDSEQMAELIEVKPEKFERVWQKKLARKFLFVSGRWYNFRLEQTRLEKLKASESVASRNRQAAEARWKRNGKAKNQETPIIRPSVDSDLPDDGIPY